jgi:hypothetical protein
MKINNYIEYLLGCESELSKSFLAIGKQHVTEPDVHSMCNLFSSWCDEHVEQLKKQSERFGREEEDEPDRLDHSFLKKRSDGLGLLRDLHTLYLLTADTRLSWIVLSQCSKSIRDSELRIICNKCGLETHRQEEWIISKIKISASQVLTVPV